jgi:hypothetical protein
MRSVLSGNGVHREAPAKSFHAASVAESGGFIVRLIPLQFF